MSDNNNTLKPQHMATYAEAVVRVHKFFRQCWVEDQAAIVKAFTLAFNRPNEDEVRRQLMRGHL